uniref:Uncharacterized protein n=1 Tax=Palpitomonas bilix TaxID=652834 RepID=A0A7S3GFU3_9EUKA|mmetsp:Transcript_47550/g.123127  ORF Transcript_47550/g.123127 Transcript_47550/m.123127 type:complete len:168 (+) Transcript_47550:265-768(+)
MKKKQRAGKFKCVQDAFVRHYLAIEEGVKQTHDTYYSVKHIYEDTGISKHTYEEYSKLVTTRSLAFGIKRSEAAQSLLESESPVPLLRKREKVPQAVFDKAVHDYMSHNVTGEVVAASLDVSRRLIVRRTKQIKSGGQNTVPRPRGGSCYNPALERDIDEAASKGSR